MKLSIIIVNYNVKHFLHQCLKSINTAKKEIQLEVIVVDNNSVDNSIKMLKEDFADVHVIVNEENRGFSKANNQAIKLAKGEYILLLNPDTVIQENTLSATIDFLDNNLEAGALGVKMIDGNGNFLPESKRSLPTPAIAFYKIFGLSKIFPKSKKFGKYHLNYLDPSKIHEIDVISGAFFMTRKKILNEIELLDETFFMYGEDIDLSYRIQKHGYKNFYLPETSIIHYKGESTKKTSLNYVIIFYQAMILFVKKHYNQKTAAPLIHLIKIAIFIRATVSIIKRIFLKILTPIIDALVMLLGMLFLKDIWAENYFSNINYYDEVFLNFLIPTYIIFWITGIYLKGGYNKMSKKPNLVKGIILGTILLLVGYGLLPENLRFSRALIILGSIWSIISVLLLRIISNIFKTYFFNNKDYKRKRIGIIGDEDEFKRINEIIKKVYEKNVFVGQIDYNKKTDKNLGHINQLEEIIKIHQLNEIIFSAKDINANRIIQYMSEINKSVNIKISPTESTFVIGSSSIHAQEDLYSLKNIKRTNNSIKTFLKKYIDFFN